MPTAKPTTLFAAFTALSSREGYRRSQAMPLDDVTKPLLQAVQSSPV
jgi:hypothetical protein